MFFRKPTDVSTAWEAAHGKLDQIWVQQFLDHEAMANILKHLDEHISVAVRRNKKLHDVLKDLRQQEYALAEFNRNLHPHTTSPESRLSIAGRIEDSSKSKIESREGESGRWGRTYS